MKLHRQNYYAWLAQPVTDAEYDAAYVANAIFDAHREDPEFGYRLLHDEVTATGIEVSDRTVWKICSDNQWWCVFGTKRRSRWRGPPRRRTRIWRAASSPPPRPTSCC
ncbi:hypothetical protein FB384_004167 [Prauserella sediminis]|uniref:HTH-like domain-containing protein n=1 Tax=Prauserella sediminis TaxID=577680 RepID=A0A839XUZ9_9PSEU|nr:hypothetical protein [Prauserella sediminis]MBB3665214.1 hypothetical protein [Prauserella sediminis]